MPSTRAIGRAAIFAVTPCQDLDRMTNLARSQRTVEAPARASTRSVFEFPIQHQKASFRECCDLLGKTSFHFGLPDADLQSSPEALPEMIGLLRNEM